MTLVKYTPRTALWRPSTDTFNDIDSWFSNIFSGNGYQYESHRFSPRYDIRSYDERYELMVELPGVSKKEVEVEVSDGALTIQGERKDADDGRMYSTSAYGKFSRSFYMPDDAIEDKLSASMDSGILTITIPRIEPERLKVKQIKIK